eukprot:symbB.v1.2.010018.t1/scaffold648.1/size176576/3
MMLQEMCLLDETKVLQAELLNRQDALKKMNRKLQEQGELLQQRSLIIGSDDLEKLKEQLAQWKELTDFRSQRAQGLELQVITVQKDDPQNARVWTGIFITWKAVCALFLRQ